MLNEFFLGAAASGYIIERSLRFNSDDSSYLSRTPSSAGNRKTWTWSAWIKGCTGVGDQVLFSTRGFNTTSDYVYFGIMNTGFFRVEFRDGTTLSRNNTNNLLRDPAAWYHIVVQANTSESAAADRMKLWINNEEVSWSADDRADISTSHDYAVNKASEPHAIGALYDSSYTNFFNGYMADVHLIDGQALAPTDFGEYDDNNVWQPKAFAGTYGTNGFHLDFSDNSTAADLGTDSSGNGNTWTVNNISVASGAGNDSLIDTPTNYTASSGNNGGNYATLNPITEYPWTLSNGNLECTAPISPVAGHCPATIFVNSGKWYAEVTTVNNTTDHAQVGVVKLGAPTDARIGDNGGAGWEPERDRKRAINGTLTEPFFNNTYTDNVVTLGLALDMDDGTLDIYVNGTLEGELISGLSGYYTFAVGDVVSTQQPSYKLNFGQRPFAYSAPSGFKALCTTNLPTATVPDGSQYFDATLYTGNGSTQSISVANHSPDLVWVKSRNDTTGHRLFDTVRGDYEFLESNSTGAETTNTNQIAITSSGFDTGASVNTNDNNDTYVAWTWDAGSSTVSNTDGSITSNVRANQSAGFSIVTYTGTGSAATIGHGLNAAPEFILVKRRDAVKSWIVYHASLGNTVYLNLDRTDNSVTGATNWNSTDPTSSVFSVIGTEFENGSGATYLAYCFAPISQYSAFGVYTGNGLANGPFVNLGFRPAWIMYKAINEASAAADWFIRDYKRLGFNHATGASNNPELEANDPDIENNNGPIDILSNGFKIRSNNPGHNTANEEYLYMAFAEHPFRTARAR